MGDDPARHPPRNIESDSVARETSIRLDDELMAAVDREAQFYDVSRSEFVRSALVFAIGWHMAMRASRAGGNADNLLRYDEMAKRLAELSKPDGKHDGAP